MYFLYSVLTVVALLVLLPYFLVKGLRTGKYIHNLGERLGYLPPGFSANRAAGAAIWVHAVSVGEALAGLPLARRLKARFPDRPLYVSTTTSTGQALARERMPFADGFFYFPMDWDGPIRRVLAAVRPALVVVLETEIWPNFLRQCRRAAIPVVFVNGRISERSYRRYRLLDGFLARVLGHADLFLMQSPEDALRIGALGAPAERVVVGGNLKYDVPLPPRTPLGAWLEAQVAQQGRRPVVVAGSVVAEEEPGVLRGFDAVRRRWPRALLVLAPRKPERFDSAARIAAQAGHDVARRSGLRLDEPLPASTAVVLLDTLGELADLYRLADVVFVGGSLVPAGGHNLLEPAACGKPPVFGAWISNFREIAEQVLAAGAGIQVSGADALGQAWVRLLDDPALSEAMGAAARRLVESNRGATDRALERIAALLESRRSSA